MRKYDKHARSMAMDLSSPEAFLKWQGEASQKLYSVLGLGLMEMPSSLAPRELDRERLSSGITRRHMTIQVEDDVTMPFYLLEPAGEVDDGIFLCAPGHQGGGKASLVGDRSDEAVSRMIDHYSYDFALKLAQEGHVAIAFDSRGFGERREFAQQDDVLGSSCVPIAHMAEPLGYSLAGLLVWDIMRLVDYVTGEGFKTVHMIGFSGGGLQTLYASALDKRISDAFISGYYYGFKDSLLVLNGNCACNYVPSLWRYFEVSDMAAMSAPRPLMIQSAESDHLNGPRGLDNVTPYVEELFNAYNLLGVSDKLVHHIIPGPHHFDWDDARMAYQELGLIKN